MRNIDEKNSLDLIKKLYKKRTSTGVGITYDPITIVEINLLRSLLKFECMDYHIIKAILSVQDIGSLELSSFIDSLKNITLSESVNDHLIKWTIIIKEQNEMLDRSNKLLDEQVGILRNSLAGTLLNDEASNRLAEIENQKLLLSIKPRFIYEGATFGLESSHIKVRLKNKGDVAIIKSVIADSDIIFVTGRIEGKEIEKDQIFYLPINVVDRLKTNKDYTLTLIYTDKLKNEYKLNIIGKGQSIKLEE